MANVNILYYIISFIPITNHNQVNDIKAVANRHGNSGYVVLQRVIAWTVRL